MDSHHFQVLHDTQELYDCRRLNQSIITSEVTYSIAAVATFFLTLIIKPLQGEESRDNVTSFSGPKVRLLVAYRSERWAEFSVCQGQNQRAP